jgi:gluconolactonase
MTRKRALVCIVTLAGCVPHAHAAETTGSARQIRGDASIVDHDAKLERIFTGAVFTEGPAQGPDGALYFSQITPTRRPRERGQPFAAGHIWRLDTRTGRATIFRSPSGQANGLEFDAQGRLLIAEGSDSGGRRLVRTDLAAGSSVVLAADFEGRPFNSPNDLVVDALGRIYFTDPRYFGREPVEQPVQGVYRIDTDGTISRISANAGKPNGITISPDQSTLYVSSLDFGANDFLPGATPTESGAMQLYAFPLHADGTLGDRKVLIDFAPGSAPDGITVDRDGNLYLAVPDDDITRQGILVVSPAGRELAFIPVPESPTNVKFGRGAGIRTLFITSSESVFRIEVRRHGFHAGGGVATASDTGKGRSRR